MKCKTKVYLGDHLTGFLRDRVTENPYLLAILYSVVGIGVCIGMAFLNGSILRDASSSRIELLEDYLNIFNFCLILPVSIIFIIRFYENLASLQTLMNEGVLQVTGISPDSVSSRIRKDLSYPWISLSALGIAIAVNVVAAQNMQGMWYSVSEGLVWIWFRIFATANFYILVSFLIKGFLAVRVLRRLFNSSHTRIVLQPMHQDGVSGLRPLSLVAVSMNKVLFVLFAYAYVTVFLETAATHRLLLIVPAISVYPFIMVYLMFVSLRSVKQSLVNHKQETLEKLNREFTSRYSRVFDEHSGENVNLKAVKDFGKLESLHRYVSRMTVWPMNISVLKGLLFNSGLTVVMAVIIEFLKRYIQ